MTRTDPYALHRPTTVDPQHAYCMQARATLARLKANRKPSLMHRIARALKRG